MLGEFSQAKACGYQFGYGTFSEGKGWEWKGTIFMTHETVVPVITGVSYFLAHIPDMIRYGSKPYRELKHEPSLVQSVISHQRPFDEAMAYPPNQVFIGNLDPDELWDLPSPW